MKKIIIEKNNSGKRVDKFLKEEVFLNLKISRGEIVRNIKDGNVLVDKKVVKPSYVLKEDDVIVIRHKTCLPAGEAGNIKQKTVTSNPSIKVEIIYEDKNIIVINKPAGIRVHPDFHEKNNTLANALLAKYPEIKNVGDDPMRPGIVHRLDKDTSGVMVVARNQKTFLELKNKFKNREIEKKYWAIVCGELGRVGDKGTIDKPIARAASYKKQVVAGRKTRTKIREAVTEYEVLDVLGEHSLLEVSPKTGRTHQIRVHLNSIGHPVVGDQIYKMKKPSTAENAKRQLLHAKKLEFELFGRKYAFEINLPRDFANFLTKAQNKDRI